MRLLRLTSFTVTGAAGRRGVRRAAAADLMAVAVPVMMVSAGPAAAAFPATQRAVSHKWINYTGCDSLYSTAADTSTAYFGGHERWSQNPRGCDFAGPGAISAPGMEGLSPSTGALTFNPTRGRGLGADDMLLTGAGLWIASDNFDGTSTCGGVSGHAGICFPPYS